MTDILKKCCISSHSLLHVNIGIDSRKHTTLKARVNPMLRETL